MTICEFFIITSNFILYISKSLPRKCGSLYVSQPYGPPWPVRKRALLFFLSLSSYVMNGVPASKHPMKMYQHKGNRLPIFWQWSASCHLRDWNAPTNTRHPEFELNILPHCSVCVWNFVSHVNLLHPKCTYRYTETYFILPQIIYSCI
jgi:hypothetical protein